MLRIGISRWIKQIHFRYRYQTKFQKCYWLLSVIIFALLFVLILIIIKKSFWEVFLHSQTQEWMDRREQAPLQGLNPMARNTNTEPLYFINQSFYDGIAVFIDNRPEKTIPFHIFNVLQHIPVTWPVQIFHSKANYDYLSQNLNLKPHINSGRIILTKLFDEELFDMPNELLTNVEFYKQVRGAKILNFELDSAICSNSPHKLSDFLQYDYIGAPWRWTNKPGSVGNSGLCLINRNKIIELLQKNPYNHHQNVDEWLSAHFHLVNASIPTPQIAATFSVESLYYDNPFGIHMPGIYLNRSDYQALCKQCPETRMIRPYCQDPR